ncbi:carboxypeptidase-like regulatory domain-containing protein [Winogradskyella psychrotolerans]|uniref:carboxypeptidase-like regulatory domain-containing protein n=1 Tax=Winogradskyella psychrotolerans TaxID=1344585 RepID=UPI001C06A811|nr:carboxypeptidase-like regulatory domain-containing protein [Winogradskyella psychrotolerans]MBU2927499.1 carboxypeptidase-like regulatory domain-containing protein [Winogradskyella psychrotolerans]
MKKTLLLLLLFTTLATFGQDIERITVNGRIVVSTDDKEGVAVFNSSSNKGTYTDADGNFELDVALNDVVEFGALQFEDFTVTITDKVLLSKRLTVILVEEVNKLDEVVLLPFDLTGNLGADLENVRTYNVSLDDVYFGLDNIEDFEFSADYKTKADNLAFNEYNPYVGNMLDLVNVAGFLIKQVVNVEDKKPKSKRAVELEKTPFKKALDTYSVNYIHNNFDIPLDQVPAFIDYVEKEGIADSLFEENKEMQLLERISQLSKAFLKDNSEKE